MDSIGLYAPGFVAGVINTVAGGGSLLTLPVLMALGLNADVANGSNRLGVLAQSLMSTFVFVRHGQFDWGGVRRFVVPVVLGAMVGAQVSIALPEMWLRASIAVVMVAVLCFSLGATEAVFAPDRPAIRGPNGSMAHALYGRFAPLSAGAGILFLGVLVLVLGNLWWVQCPESRFSGSVDGAIACLRSGFWRGRRGYLRGQMVGGALGHLSPYTEVGPYVGCLLL